MTTASHLAQVLIHLGYITATAIEEALDAQVVHGGSLGTNLLELKSIEEVQLNAALTALHQENSASKQEIDAIAAAIPQQLPRSFAETYRMVPFSLDAAELVVLVAEETDAQLIDLMRARVRIKVRTRPTSELRLHYAMHRLYGSELLPRYKSLILRLDGALPPPLTQTALPAATAPAAARGDQLLSWGLSQARIDSPQESPAPSEHPQAAADQESAALSRAVPPTSAAAAKPKSDNHPLDLRPYLQHITAAQNRDEVVDALLAASLHLFDYAALLLVQGDQMHGWRSINPEATRRLAAVSIATTAPSIFQTVWHTQGHYLGPMPSSAAHAQFCAAVGRALPRTVLLAPVRVGGKMVALLYADRGDAAVAPQRAALLLLLTQKAGSALEEIVRRRKRSASGVREATPKAAPAVEEMVQEEDEAKEEEIETHPSPDAAAPTATPPPTTDPAGSGVDFADIETFNVPLSALAEGANAAAPPTQQQRVFAEIDDSAAEALDDWEDVLLDTTCRDHAAAMRPDPAHSGTATPADSPQPPPIGWHEVLTELDVSAQLAPQPAPSLRPPELPAPPPLVRVAPPSLAPEEATLPLHAEPPALLAALWDELHHPDAQVRAAAIAQALEHGSGVDAELTRHFPGEPWCEPFAPGVRLPPLAQCSAILALVAARGAEAAAAVLPHLDHNDPLHRFFAIYYLLNFPCGAACELLARRLYDTAPHNRYLAAEALRRCAREPAYQRIVNGLREQLRVPFLANQVTTIQILGQLREPTAVPSLIPLVTASQMELSRTAMSSLLVICAQTFGHDRSHWQHWWQTHHHRPRALWLLEGLLHRQEQVRRLAHDELEQITGETIAFDAGGSAEARTLVARSWFARLHRAPEARG